MNNNLLLELKVDKDNMNFINKEILETEKELEENNNLIQETVKTLELITPQCDKIDYILATCSGIICGVIDIFLVGTPLNTKLGNYNDEWVSNRIIDFAKLNGYDGEKNPSSAIKFLEKKYKVPYDQSVGGEVFKDYINLTPSNHHFKSLGHNPTLMGLFFSIINQFNNTSNFVSNGELITLSNNDNVFELRGNSFVGKLYCGIINWIGHLLSDVSGSSTSVGRGMGIPSPILSWSNDIIVLKRKLNIPVSDFDKYYNEQAQNIFLKGFDSRFQTIQFIPIFINEMIVRLFYSVRRLMKYLAIRNKADRKINEMWQYCNPFSNATVKRMLTVAHGTFCLIDISEATLNGLKEGSFVGVAIRLNIIGIGRFTISIFKEIKNIYDIKKVKEKEETLIMNRDLLIDYLSSLKELSTRYDDKLLFSFINDLENSKMYKEGFKKTVLLAQKRNVPDDMILHNKKEIDSFFIGESNDD